MCIIREALLLKDELLRELAAGRLLGGFSSLTPTFPPTFKVPLVNPRCTERGTGISLLQATVDDFHYSEIPASGVVDDVL